jgi:hypothetical protein
MTCNHPNTHEARKHCALAFGQCWYVKGRRDKQSNKPNGSHPEDIKIK